MSVLNASYEALGNTSLKRAIALVKSGRAEIVEADDARIVRWANGIMPWPKIIVLLEYLRVPFYVGPAHFSKAGVRKRDNYVCAFCGKTGDTVDHVLPKSRGGKDTWENTVCACTRCNGRKADRTPEEAGMKLLFEPWAPQRVYLTGGKRRKEH